MKEHLPIPLRLVLLLGLLLLSSPAAPQSQQKAPPAPGRQDGTQSDWLDDWLKDNIDPDVLRALNQLDDQKAQKLLSELQQAMNGTNIYSLSTLRQTAMEVIPLLQKYEETAPYGDWLQSRLDYLESAQELEREAKAAAPKTALAPTLPAPSLKMQRQVWGRLLAQRPWPPLARSYVPQLKAVFASEGAPPELVWVAEVESSFKADARSPAGAAGMFQLMRQTARQEQLSLWPWDQRLEPQKSARAAARYLRQLHNRYGDWELALAAYNAGQGRVDKLLKQQKAHSFEAIAPRLPAETQMYVPRVEATILKREGRELQDFKLPKG